MKHGGGSGGGPTISLGMMGSWCPGGGAPAGQAEEKTVRDSPPSWVCHVTPLAKSAKFGRPTHPVPVGTDQGLEGRTRLRTILLTAGYAHL